MDSKKRSQIVLLSLIGLPVAVGLAAELAPEGEQVRRNLYQDRAACERHYSPAQCEPRSGGVGGFHGPRGDCSHCDMDQSRQHGGL